MKQKTISLLLALALALSLAGCQKEETVTAPAGVAGGWRSSRSRNGSRQPGCSISLIGGC